MPTRRAARLFLLLALMGVAAPLLADDACDEPCGVHCGDCVWCPLAGDLSLASHGVDLPSAEFSGGSHRSAPFEFARIVDHVPLLG
jgi:hypothetical protein